MVLQTRSTTLLILLGVVLLAIGFHGYSQMTSTLLACSPEPTIWDIRVIDVSLHRIAYTDGCNGKSVASHAVLGPIGIIVILLGIGTKAFRLFPQLTD